MKKISFDAEDHPPLSYYKDTECSTVDGSNTIVVTNQPSSLVDKSEWWKAPEFVPKKLHNVEMPAVHHPHHQIVQNDHNMVSFNRLQFIPEIVDKQQQQQQQQQQQNVLIHQPINFPRHGFPLPMSTMPTNVPGPMRPYPPPVFPMPGMHRPFLPQMPVLPPQMQQFNPLFNHHQHSFRQPRLYPRGLQLNNTGIPSGYTANMTTINAGHGNQIPAIVIKKKRKKKSKKGKDIFSTSMYESDKRDAISDLKSKESSPDDKSSITPSQSEVGRSEPDLTLHKFAQSSNFPADLDLIQSTTNCAILTGSWPDLSEPQRQMIHNSGMYRMYYEDNYNHGDGDEEVVYESRLNQSALNSRNNWDENENEEDALLKDNQSKRAETTSERKTNENNNGRNIIVRTTMDGIATQLLPNESKEETNLTFKGNRRRTFSLPDVPLAISNGSKVCCSLM